ncbi:hypothetical protein CERZMDRAFT_102087 [Cercospora zeae-maydis SCOH1-5]|uniref:Uncharacterized protein n=1 Tax=Cercospora zeae-maydis SCOH1-5 TaxID=717836 RepID=A0A6A6F5J8_9PEZI|nr:hypothetical protein CERZMDRAFT_102087 [Cercospora zeae-maydis SCOH1-5]
MVGSRSGNYKSPNVQVRKGETKGRTTLPSDQLWPFEQDRDTIHNVLAISSGYYSVTPASAIPRSTEQTIYFAMLEEPLKAIYPVSPFSPNKSFTSERRLNLSLSLLERSKIGHSKSGYSKRGHSKIGHSKSGYSKSGHSKIGHSKSGHSKSGHSKRGHSKIGHSKSGHSKSGHSKRGYSKRGHSKSGHR